MWTCRKCSAEVEDHFEICWSCGTSVDGAQDPSFRRFERDEDVPAPAVTLAPQTVATEKLVAIATYWVAGQAHEVQCILEADGIPVTVAYEFGIATDWFLDAATGCIQLQVPEAQVEKARKVLADHPKEATPLPPAPPKPPEPDEEEKYKAQPWLAPLPKELSREEALKFLESQLSALMDSKHVPDWKVNPAFHPDVMAFIQKHANNIGFVQKAQALQRNRAKYFATMRAQALAPKPVEEEKPQEQKPQGPPLTVRLGKALTYAFVTLPLAILLRLLKWAIVLGIAAVVLGVMASFIYRGYGQGQLEDAIKETEKLDNAWKWEHLQVTRTEVAEKDNGALLVEAVARRLPEPWPGKESPLGAIEDLPPNQRLSAEQAAALRSELEKQQAPLEDARRLEQFATGRFPVAPPDDTPLHRPTPWRATRPVARLLVLEAALQAHDQDFAKAMASCRAALRTASTVGDEPDAMAQLGRFAVRRQACAAIERVLAQTAQTAEEPLAQTQQLLEEAVNEPALLAALRGVRAFVDATLAEAASGNVAALLPDDHPDKAEQAASAQSAMGGLERWIKAGWISDNRAKGLRLLSAAVELAKLPVDQQAAKFQDWDDNGKKLKVEDSLARYALAYFPLPAVSKIAQSSHRSAAELRCAALLLAVERFRRATGQWPESLAQLAPKFLPAVPLDPFDGQPLRYRKVDDGVVIYSIGPDGVDNHGDLFVPKRDRYPQEKDIGFRLWNVDRRGAN